MFQISSADAVLVACIAALRLRRLKKNHTAPAMMAIATTPPMTIAAMSPAESLEAPLLSEGVVAASEEPEEWSGVGVVSVVFVVDGDEDGDVDGPLVDVVFDVVPLVDVEFE